MQKQSGRASETLPSQPGRAVVDGRLRNAQAPVHLSAAVISLVVTCPVGCPRPTPSYRNLGQPFASVRDATSPAQGEQLALAAGEPGHGWAAERGQRGFLD